MQIYTGRDSTTKVKKGDSTIKVKKESGARQGARTYHCITNITVPCLLLNSALMNNGSTAGTGPQVPVPDKDNRRACSRTTA